MSSNRWLAATRTLARNLSTSTTRPNSARPATPSREHGSGYAMTIGTTHDPQGGGHPRFTFWRSDVHAASATEHMFPLMPGVTTIGSSPTADLSLTGLAEQHGEVRRDSADEYVYVHLDPGPPSTVNGAPAARKPLHTGDRLMLGPWTLTFSREEFADHGRPHGGRQGGESARQRPQRLPRLRGTSPDGGSSQDRDNPGEYY